MSNNPINFNTLKSMKEVMGQVFIQLVPTYIEQSDEMISEMPELLNSGTIDILERNAHSMKSSSLNVGAEDLSRIASELENMSRSNGNKDALKEKIIAITEEYAKVKIALQDYLQTL